MDFFKTYIVFIIFFVALAMLFIYKIATKRSLAITSKFLIDKELRGNLQDNFAVIESAMKSANFKRIKYDDVGKTFYAKTTFSMWSFTEEIVIKILEKEYSIILNFKSICALPTQIIDYGKNKTNYRRFEKGFKIRN